MERTVVVQSVLNRQRGSQFAVLEYSFNGDTTGRLGSSALIPPGRPQIPLSGAVVTVSYQGSPACAGRLDTLRETSGGTSGVYQSSSLCALVPGSQALLRVVTPDGEVVSGQTRIPGFNMRSVSSGGRLARFVMDTLHLYRERDTVRVQMGSISGEAMQIEVRRAENHSDLSMYLFTDSLGLAMPGTLSNPFNERSSSAFRPGRFYLLTLALADTNYFDYIRSLSDPVTGRGFLNHLEGGIGVFGSVDVESYLLRVTGDQHDPREGTYRLVGSSGNFSLDLTLEAYLALDPEVDAEQFSALVSGSMREGTLTTNIGVSGDGQFGTGPVSGAGNPDAFQFSFSVIRTQPNRFRQITVRGIRSANRAGFPAEVVIANQNGATLLRANLMMQQVSGPTGS